jgi:hypothetical protein
MGHVGDVYDECNSPDQREGTLYLYTLTRSWFDEPPDFLLLCLVKDVMLYFCSLNQKVAVPVKRRSCCLQLCYGKWDTAAPEDAQGFRLYCCTPICRT